MALSLALQLLLARLMEMVNNWRTFRLPCCRCCIVLILLALRRILLELIRLLKLPALSTLPTLSKLPVLQTKRAASKPLLVVLKPVLPPTLPKVLELQKLRLPLLLSKQLKRKTRRFRWQLPQQK